MKIIVLVVAFFFTCSSAFASGEDAKLAAAKRYLNVTPMSEMFVDMADKMANQIPEDKRAQFIKVMTSEVDINKLESAALDAMMQTFTIEELNAFADFYGSKVGKSAMGKFGTYMSLVMPTVQQEMMRAIEKVQ
jgi:hypothetical protein